MHPLRAPRAVRRQLLGLARPGDRGQRITPPLFPLPLLVFLMSFRLASAGAPEQASTGHQATKSHGCHGRRSAPGTSWPYLEGDGQALLVFTSAGLLSEIAFVSVPSESLRRLDRSS